MPQTGAVGANEISAQHNSVLVTSPASQTGYSQLTVVPCLVKVFTPRVGRRW